MYSSYPTKGFVTFWSIVTIVFTIFSIAVSLQMLYHTHTLTKYYDIIFSSDKEEANFLNIALSNLIPNHFFADIKCYFIRSSASSEMKDLSFSASIKKLKENNIIESIQKTYSGKFAPNSLNSSKIALFSSSTSKIDAIRLQLSFNKPFGSLKGTLIEYSFVSGSEATIVRPISCAFSFIIIISLFSYLQNLQDVSISDFYCALLAFLGFISLNPFLLIQNSSNYTSFDDFSMPIFNSYIKMFAVVEIYEFCKQSNTRHLFKFFLFFCLLFSLDSIQGIAKISQIKNDSMTKVPVSIIDILYIAVNLIYVVIASRLFFIPLKTNLVLFLLVVNCEQIVFALINVVVTAIGMAFSMNGKAIITFNNVLVASICIFAMQKKKYLKRRGMDNDEEPLFSSRSYE